jgi:hypothetical protein
VRVARLAARRVRLVFAALVLSLPCIHAAGAGTITVRPTEIDDVLTNPGIGFTTFKVIYDETTCAGDGWPTKESVAAPGFPACSVAYLRVYWNALEPEKGKYNWALVDEALRLCEQNGQTLMMRLPPYGRDQKADAPKWYREMVGKERRLPVSKWVVDPEDPRYVEHYGALVRAFGKRYDGNPTLESMDLGIVGSWGEGAGSNRLTQKTREALLDAYLESFTKTPLTVLLMDSATHAYINSRGLVGFRADCLGDMGGFGNGKWSHMNDGYPQAIIQQGLRDAWQKRPVTFEVGWNIEHWFKKGWDVDHIIAESLKWHVSSINAKSSPVPEPWRPNVDRWLKKMGYRLVLRKFTYPDAVEPGGALAMTSWWDNKGVAPCYKDFALALRLKDAARETSPTVLLTSADIRTWLPGDNLHDEELTVPKDLRAGEYNLQIGIVDRVHQKAKIQLAIQGRETDGWYTMGKIIVRKPPLLTSPTAIPSEKDR